ncbi:MAG: rhomboid family intramembrane serine protease [Phycisphaerales bacterium]|nr:rhomboid family intramembrane serine protease [Phycisphaerales bacterium]
MFILLGTDTPLRKRPLVTEAMVVLMLAAYLAILAIGLADKTMAAQLLDAMALSRRDFQWWQPLTYLIAHDNPLLGGETHPLWRLLHLGFNLMGLWVFGAAVEDRIGHASMIIFSLLGGVIAGLAQAWSSPESIIGASGMVGALAGGFIVLRPRCRIRVLIVFILIRIWMVPALWIIAFWILMDLIGWAGVTDQSVAHVAHLAGYLWGGFTMALLLLAGLVPGHNEDIWSQLKLWNRRRTYKQVIASQDQQHGAPPARAKPKPKGHPELSALRSMVAAGDMQAAAQLWQTIATEDQSAILGRQPQLTLANHLQASGQRDAAAEAYRRFLHTYPNAPESAEVRLLLCVLLVRTLGRPTEAVPILNQSLADSLDQRRHQLAQTLLREATA